MDGFILGSEDFVNWVKETFLFSEKVTKEKPQLNALHSGVDVEDIVAETGETFDVDSDGILVKGKKRNLARDVAICLSRKHSRRSGKSFGTILAIFPGQPLPCDVRP